MATATRTSRINALTAWRGLFALGIVLFHHNVAHTEAVTRAGVCFFFVVSGFLMQRRHGDDHLGSLRDYGRYLAGRAARLFPPHWFALLAMAALLVVFKHRTVDSSLALHTALLQAWSPVHDVHYGWNSVAWFLSALLFCYACFPLLSRTVCRRPLRVQAALLLLAAVVLGAVMPLLSDDTRDALYVFPAVRVLDFLLGMTLANAVGSGKLRLPAAHAAATAIEIAAVVLLAELLLAAELTAMLEPWVYFLMWWLPVAALIVATALADARHTPLQRMLNTRPLLWLGSISLEVYLLQNVMQLAVNYLLAPLVGHFGGNIYHLNVWFSVPLLLPAAWLMHRLVTRPLRQATVPKK